MVIDFSNPQFWVAVLQIIAIDIVLGGDNAVVIALACRRLPERQRNLGIMWGVAGAIALRVVLIFFALSLLAIPFLKVVGAVLLLWIGIKMLQPEAEGDGGHAVDASTTLLGAIKTVIVADAVMSLDNVIAIAGAAKGSLGLVVFGLVVSVPIIVWGSKLVMRLMDRFPSVVVLGGMLLGWIAGDMTVTDVALKAWMQANVPGSAWVGPIIGAVFVVAVGKWLAARALAKRPALVELGERVAAAGAAPGPAVASLVNRILLPVDASDSAARAVEYVIAMRRHHPAPEAMDIHLLNVQRGVSGEVSSFLAKASLQDYHRENSISALARARKMLDDAGAKYSTHMLVGKPWEVISEYANANHCDQIVMGTRGMGSYSGALLGSVAQGVAQHSVVPVLLVK
jgi:YjbE family integral membrane protein